MSGLASFFDWFFLLRKDGDGVRWVISFLSAHLYLCVELSFDAADRLERSSVPIVFFWMAGGRGEAERKISGLYDRDSGMREDWSKMRDVDQLLRKQNCKTRVGRGVK